MGKALKTVGLVIGAAAMIASGVGALAMPGLAGSVTLFGVSTGTLNMISAGLTAVGGLLDKPESTGSGSPTDWTSNPDQPTPFAFGRVGASGKVIHRDEYGKDNKLQGIVSVYSGAGPIKAFISYKADDLAVSFESNGGTAIGKYRRQMWRSWRFGNQPDTALSLPTGLDEGAVMPAWDYRYKLSGKACELLTVQQDSKFSVYPGGCPTPFAVFDGIYGYDPRYDDTYVGGVGPCRLGDRATYRWIENPIIAALNWALGMVENGQVVGGIGASINGIDVPAFVEAANIADANEWIVSAWPDTSEDVSSVLKQFLQAGGASYARHAGKISCVSRGAARASIVTITARDTTGPLELDTGSSSFNRLNTITPEIMSAAHGWKHVPADPVTFAALVAEDGGKKSDSIQYRFVPKVKQGAQLAAYDILDAREPFSGTIPLKPHLRRLKRGDCFTISEPGFLLDGVKCMVLTRTYDAQKGEVRIAFRSETDSKHDLALGKTTAMPVYPELTPADPTLVSPPLPEDWVIVPRPPAPDGTQVPGFDLTGIVSNDTADAMLVNWREVAVGEDPDAEPAFQDEEGVILPGWNDAGIWPPTTRTLTIQGPQSGSVVWLAIRYKRGNNYSEPVLVGPKTTGDLIAGGLSPDSPDWDAIRAVGGTAAAEAETRLQAALDAAKSQLEAADALTASALLAADTRLTNAVNGKASNATVTALKSQADGLSAWRVTAEQVLTDLPNNYASASSVTGLQSEVTAARSGSPTLLARLTADRQVVTDGLAGKASASDLTALTSRMTSAEGVNTAQNTRLNTVETDLSGKAASSDLTNLAATVTGQGTTISGHATRLTTVESDLVGKASTSAVTTIQALASSRTRVFRQPSEPGNPANGYPLVQGDLWIKNGAGNNEEISLWTGSLWTPAHDPRIASTAGQVVSLGATVSGHQTAISDLQTGKASASDLTALTTRVTTAEGVNTAQNTRLNTAESDILGKASAASVATLSSEVTTARNGSPSLAAQLTSMRQTVTDGLAGKASTTDVTTLFSRMGAAEASITTVASTAALANGKANAIVGNVLDVNGFISGTKSENDGVRSSFEVLASTFAIRAVGTAARTEFIDGIWYAYDATNSVRSSWGRPHGANGHGLTWWTGPNSVAKGSEVKGNAYVFISMNTVGGPRFGGSDVPSGVVVPKIVSVSAQTAVLTFNSALTDGIWDMSLYALSAPGWTSGAPSGTWAIYEQNVGSAGTAGTLIASGSVRPNGDYEPTTFDFGGGASSAVKVAGDRQLRVIVSGISATSLIFRATYSSATGGGGGGGSGGGSTGPALSDTAPPAIASAGAVGTAATAARGDHTHAHGNQGGGALHAAATPSTAGFMPAADKTKLDGITLATAPTANAVVQRTASGAIEFGAARSHTGTYYFTPTEDKYLRGRSVDPGFVFSHAATGPSFTPTSDLVLKENVEAVSNDPAAVLEVLSAGQIEYDRVQDGVHALGFSAQALRDINPLWVVGGEVLDPEGPPEDLEGAVIDEDGVTFRRPLAVDPMAMVSSLFAAVRQLANDTGYAETRLEQALNRIEALEAEVAALTAA